MELDRNHLDSRRPVGSVNNSMIKNSYTNNTHGNWKVIQKCRLSGAVSLQMHSEPRRVKLTDVKAVCPHVEAHLGVRKGAVAQRPAGKGFRWTQTERKRKDEERRPKVLQRHSKQVKTSSLHTPRADLVSIRMSRFLGHCHEKKSVSME